MATLRFLLKRFVAQRLLGLAVVVTLAFSGGSVATIAYHAMGDPSLPKERIEVARGDRSVVLDDFRALTLSRGGDATRAKATQDKGHRAEARAFVKALRAGGPPPTGKSTRSDYVYSMEFDGPRIRHMTKIWNAGWAMKELGWA